MNPCPICNSGCALHDVVDFNKSCEEDRGKYLALSGIPIYYALCDHCGHCFSPEMCSWSMSQFDERVYNEGYAAIDPDYADVRPKSNAAELRSLFPSIPADVRHLDYGGGNGLLSALLNENGWHSASFDPYVTRGVPIETLGKYDLITSYEVFEHVPAANILMANLKELLAPNGIVIVSTILSDGFISRNRRLDWWYASPRNGHVSLFSSNSLRILAEKNGFTVGSFSIGLHMLFRDVPQWARHLFRTAG
jgi:SAM-dependent methyltransferase